MQTYRMVSRVYLGKTLERDRRTRLVRYLGPESEVDTAPFILMESIHLDTANEFQDGFPWRPYPGIEAIWYFHAAPKDTRHALSPVAEPCWVAGANGEVREEIPDLGGPEIGTQLWIGLPPEMANNTAEIPVTVLAPVVNPSAGVEVRVIGGTYGDATGPLGAGGQAGMLYLDVYLAPHAEWGLETAAPGGTMVAFLTAGEVFFGPDQDEVFEEERAVLLSEGDVLKVKATRRGGRFLLLYSPEKSAPVLDMQQVQQSEADWMELLRKED